VKPPIKHVDVARLTRLNRRTSRLRSSCCQHVWLKCAELGSEGMSGRSQKDHVASKKHRRSSPFLHRADVTHQITRQTTPPTHGLRRVWDGTPEGPRLVIPITLLLATVIVGFYAWMRPSRNDWSRLPSRLVCQVQSGPTPPPSIAVASRHASPGQRAATGGSIQPAAAADLCTRVQPRQQWHNVRRAELAAGYR
jgi:hypothetical protein